MSVLVRRSLLVLALLFGLLFAVGSAVLYYYDFPLWFALIFATVVVGLQYLLGPYIIGWIFKIRWTTPGEITPELASFVEESCSGAKIPMPRFGVIEDGNPNAFTYGHTPGDARLVVTRGLIGMLSEDELEAVVAHEIGHIKHWDFVVMTIAALIPLILYYIYVFGMRAGDRRDRSGYVWVIGMASYAAYIISQYIALFLSRVREYYADYYSARTTKNPNALATALVTIAYGLAKQGPPQPEESDDKKKKKRQGPIIDRMGSVASLSFFGKKGVSQFAMAAADASGNFSPEHMRRAMAWDLTNPWARWFELNSTHPLPAKRIREVEKHALHAHQSPVYEFAEAIPSYRNKFIADLVVMLLPYIGALCGVYVAWVGAGGQLFGINWGLPVMFFGLGMLLRTLFVYPGGSQPSSIVSLVTSTEVSHIRPIPAEIRGTIIGRGVPGLFWSDDLVMQDENGFITLIYRQPLRFLEFLFGWLKAEKFIGRKAVVRGWYRRGPGPHFEMKEARFDDGQSVRCYYYHFLLAISAVAIIVGAAKAFLGMM